MLFKSVTWFLFNLAMFANGTLFAVQGVKLFRTKSANDLSIASYIGFLAIQLATFLHAYDENDSQLMLGISYSAITTLWVIFLIFRYQRK